MERAPKRPHRAADLGARMRFHQEDSIMSKAKTSKAKTHQLKDVMSTDVKVVSPDTPISEAAKEMRDGDFGMMPVGENDRMIGAISDRDIVIRAIAEGKGPDTKVRDVMSTGIAWVFDDDSVEKAAQIMSERQVRRLPVINHEKRLVGIVALGDFAVEREELRPASEALAEISRPA
jgi:CBS domain-containing protein